MRYDAAWRPATIARAEEIAEGVRLIAIRPADGPAQPYPPGSHINVRAIIDGRQETRSYSLIGAPDPEVYRIAVQRRPDSRGGSAYMWSLAPGARIEITAPNNLFELQFGAPRYLLIAGGIGITPIYGMALALQKAGADMRLVYAGRRRTVMPFLAELFEVIGDRLHVFPSEEGARLDLAREIAALPQDGVAYLCGPMRLLDAARAEWARAGRNPAKLRYETFGSSGRFAVESFFARVPQLGIEITVSEHESLLQALERAGVGVISDCERGECGLCALRVIEVVGEIDHRDVFFSEEEKRRGEKLCTCVSRVVGGGIVLDAGYRPDRGGG